MRALAAPFRVLMRTSLPRAARSQSRVHPLQYTLGLAAAAAVIGTVAVGCGDDDWSPESEAGETDAGSRSASSSSGTMATSGSGSATADAAPLEPEDSEDAGPAADAGSDASPPTDETDASDAAVVIDAGSDAATNETTDASDASDESCGGQPCGAWVAGAYGACSATCGGGTQLRDVSCTLDGHAVADSFCTGEKPAASAACNEAACIVDVGAYRTDGTCGVLGLLGPGFTLTASAATALPAGTVIDVTGSGVANVGVFGVSGGTANVAVLSGTTRRITLTADVPAGAVLAFRTTLSISVAFTLSATTTLPAGYVSAAGKPTGSVSSTLIFCNAN